jgi:hypothetical protein
VRSAGSRGGRCLVAILFAPRRSIMDFSEFHEGRTAITLAPALVPPSWKPRDFSPAPAEVSRRRKIVIVKFGLLRAKTPKTKLKRAAIFQLVVDDWF